MPCSAQTHASRFVRKGSLILPLYTVLGHYFCGLPKDSRNDKNPSPVTVQSTWGSKVPNANNFAIRMDILESSTSHW